MGVPDQQYPSVRALGPEGASLHLDAGRRRAALRRLQRRPIEIGVQPRKTLGPFLRPARRIRRPGAEAVVTDGRQLGRRAQVAVRGAVGRHQAAAGEGRDQREREDRSPGTYSRRWHVDPTRDRLLDPHMGEPSQGGGQDDDARPGREIGTVSGHLDDEDEDRPVPQVEAVADPAEPHERASSEKILHTTSGGTAGARHDHQNRRHRRPESRRTREGRSGVQDEPTENDPRKADPSRDRPQDAGQDHTRQKKGAEAPEPELPHPGEGVVVGLRLVHADCVHRVCERSHGPDRDEEGQCATRILRQTSPNDQHGHQEEHQPDDVELPLNRHRPEVLHG